MQDVKIIDLENSQELTRCFRVFKSLRPHLDQVEFIRRVQLQAGESYQIAVIEIEQEVVAAIGYRVQHFLAWGKVLYLDDLITDPEKKKAGYASTLLQWLSGQAKILLCDEVHLDTGYQRHDAHRLYLKHGFDLHCHHLAKKLVD